MPIKKSRLLTAFAVAALALVLALAGATGCGSNSARVSPMQSKIAFASGRASGDVNLDPYIMSRDGSGVTPLPYGAMPSRPRGATVSPDDSKVLFEANASGSPTEIYTAMLDGTAVTPLTTSGSNRLPRGSPDGKQIVFMSTRDGLPGWLIYVMNADGSGQTRLSPLDNTINDIFPSFSPDGKQIVFIGGDASGYAIRTMASDGSNRTSVIVPAALPVTPAFSPDGSLILWVDSGEIASVKLDGSGRTTTTSSSGKISELMILGTEVWFTTSQDGNSEVYKMSADGSGQQNMTNNANADLLNLNVP